MFVEDIKNDFYNTLLGNRVLLLVHYDVDAVCACKILQELFKCDNISYTLVPVGGISELKAAYEENSEEVKFVVLLNCGGTVDLVDILQPEEDVVFFVLDSHKPTDVCNVYSDGQVRLVYKDEEENIPNFDDIFRDDEDEEEEIEPGREGLEAAMERRRERRAWEERRHTLMFNYTQFSYYGKPSACVLVELCWRASRVSAGAAWWGGVGCCEHAVRQLAAGPSALLGATQLHALTAHIHPCQVSLEKDALLPLYRSWSVLDALQHAPTLAPKLQPHCAAGASKLRQICADMGFPLQQARQSYRSMDVELRHCLIARLEATAARLRLPQPTAATLVLRRPLKPPLPAADVVYGVMALLEPENLPRAAGFQQALEALSLDSNTSSEAAMNRLRAVGRLAAGLAAPSALQLAGPFTYFILNEGAPDVAQVSGPLWLGVLARWAASAAGAGSPLLACAPSAQPGLSILLGIPPRFDTEPRNLFGAAFEQAASRSGVSVSLDLFDSSVILLPTSQRTQFLDALTALLA